MAITLKPARPVTDEELLELSRRNPEYRFERTATGELIVTPTGGRSGRRSGRIMQQLANWTDRHGGAAFDSSTLFRLPDGALHMPDASWVRTERWNALSDAEQEGIVPLCPDAAFEVASKSDTREDLREKMRAYLANGAQITVLIDPYERRVEVYRPGREPEIHTNPRAVALDPELPGFTLDLGAIFEV